MESADPDSTSQKSRSRGGVVQIPWWASFFLANIWIQVLDGPWETQGSLLIFVSLWPEPSSAFKHRAVEDLGIGASGLAWRCLASEEPVPGRPRLCGLPGGGLASFQLGPPTMTQLRSSYKEAKEAKEAKNPRKAFRMPPSHPPEAPLGCVID